MKVFLIALLLTASSWAYLTDEEIATFFIDDDINGDGYLTPSEVVQASTKLDSNKDGELSVDEIFAELGNSYSEALVLFYYMDYNQDGKVNSTDYTDAFKAMDVNGDGKVYVQEFANGLRDLPGAREVTLLAISGEGLSEVFDTIDTDTSGGLTMAEYDDLYKKFDKDASGDVNLAEFKGTYQTKLQLSDNETIAIFHQIDTNGDGKVDDAERTAVFKGFDANGDGDVSKKEFVQKQVIAFREIRKNLYMAGEKYPTLDEAMMQLATTGLKMIFDRKDTDKDGFVSVQEQTADSKALDKDGDGKLSASETIPAISTEFRVRKPVAQVVFKALDVNGDGFLDATDSAENVKKFDQDGNGKVDATEYRDGIIAIITLSNAVADGKYTFDQAKELIRGVEGLQMVFDGFDANDDDYISDTEFGAEAIAKVDISGDKKVSRLEFLPRFANMFKTSVPEASAIFNKIDANGDGQADEAENKAFFKSFDLNMDGKVTSYEFIRNVLNQIAQVRSAVAIATASNLFG